MLHKWLINWLFSSSVSRFGYFIPPPPAAENSKRLELTYVFTNEKFSSYNKP